MLFGTPHALAFVAGLALLIAGLVRMARVPALEAASMASLVGLAASPHAWPYDAAVALPAIFWAMTGIAEPWRTRIIVLAFAIAPLWLASNIIHFDLLAIPIIGAAVLWAARGIPAILRTEATKDLLLSTSTADPSLRSG